MEKKLKIENLPDGITSERLKFFFKNGKRGGAGSVENVDLSEDKSAIITFVDGKVVDRILNFQEPLILKDNILQVSRLPEENKTQYGFQESSSNEKNDENDLIPRQLKVENIPAGVSGERLKFLFKNEKKSGGGHVEKVDLCEDSESAIITFKESRVVDRILNFEKPIKLMDKILQISRPEEQNKTRCDFQENSNNKKDAKVNPITRQLRVDNLPNGVTVERLKFFFNNERKCGGGAVENVDLCENSEYAIITFENIKVLDRVLNFGKPMKLMDKVLKISQVEEENETQYDDPEGGDNEEDGDSNADVDDLVTRQLKVDSLPNEITVERLKSFFKNKKKCGGGSVESVDLCEDSQSAIITFENSKVVERIINFGKPMKLMDKILHISRVVEENTTQCDFQEDSHNEKDDDVHAHTKKVQSRKLKVEGLTQNIGKDRLKFFFMNKLKSGGGPIESIDLNEDSRSAIITFKKADSVDLVLSRGESCQMMDSILSVSAVFEEDFDVECDHANGDGDEENSDKKFSEKTLSHAETAFEESQDYSPQTDDFHVGTQKPSNTNDSSEEEDVDDSNENRDHDPHKGLKISHAIQYFETGQKKGFSTGTKSQNEPPFISGEPLPQKPHSSSSDEDSTVVVEASKTKGKSHQVKKTGPFLSKMGKKETREENPQTENPLLSTVKAAIIDVTKQKEFYELYLEDENLALFSYDEDSMILDGLNNCLYITFSSEKDALAMCHYNHKDEKDSNIQNVEMESDIKLQFCLDLMSVHGPDFTDSETKEKLCDFVEEKTQMIPIDVLLGEEPRSAIIRFQVESPNAIAIATWKCAKKFEDILLTTAPVPKPKTLSVSWGSSDVDMETVRRYFSNKKRSGGGPCEVAHCINGMNISYKNVSDLENVMRKSNHRVMEVDLIISPIHLCLTKAAYKHKEAIRVNNKEDSAEQTIDSDTDVESDIEEENPESQESDLHCTVKVNVINVTKPSKDMYLFYFEDIFDPLIFDEESLILDGLNSCLYVTFSAEEDASAVCEFNHHDHKDSSIASIEVVSPDKIQFYPDRISIHGLDFTTKGMREKLCDFVKKRTSQSRCDVLLGEDPSSAIVLFHDDSLGLISDATWKCAKELDGQSLVTAPVPKSKTLYVSGNLEGVDYAALKRYFASKKFSGGGPCCIEKYRNGAKVVFKSISDLENVLKRDNHRIGDLQLTVNHFHQCLCKDKGAKTSKPNDSHLPLNILDNKIKEDETNKRSEATIEKKSENPSNCIVRAHVKDVTKSKDEYMLYFEDKKFSSFPFDEKTMILDGLNQCLYFTYSKAKDASAICQFNHEEEEGSNISSIEIVCDEDVLFYSDMISIHGLDFTGSGMQEKLSRFIQEKTKSHPADIILGEEAKSAIIKFASQDFNKISDATWTCAKKLDDILLTTAPVLKSKSVFVSVDSTQVDNIILKRYYENEKRSGGGPCEVESYNNGTKVKFDSISDQENVLKRRDHRIGDVCLETTPFYFCLSKAAYMKKNAPRDTQQINPDKKLSFIKEDKNNMSGGKGTFPSPANVEKTRKKPNIDDSLEAHDLFNCTVKVNIIDVTKPKDEYELYFEDIDFALFNKNTMILDGLNLCLYVTFNTEEDAKAVCKYKHKNEDGSNISSIEIASEEDLQFYSHSISIHGLDFTAPGMIEKLYNFVEKKTTIRPVDIFLGEEQKSAIAIFPDQDAAVMPNATWKCAEMWEDKYLITAPVCKTRSVLVSCNLGKVQFTTLRRYFSNPRSGSGGGSCNVENDECGVKVTFEEEEDQEKVLKIDDHKIGAEALTLRPFHYCLSKAAYNDKVAPKVERFNPKVQPLEQIDVPKKPSKAPSPTESQQSAQKGKMDTPKSARSDMPAQKDSMTCIIKAKIIDVTKPKQFYTLYFKSDMNAQSVIEEDIALDALNRSLYVPFNNSNDAETILKWNTDDLRDNNIISVEKASTEEVQFYPDVISIHGVDFTKPKMKDRLMNFVEQKTGLKNEVILGEESKSAIIHFHGDATARKDNVYELAWKCSAEMDKVRLITAPVSFCATLKIVGDLTQIDTVSMKRFFNSEPFSKKQVLKCEKFLDDAYLINFKNYRVCDRISQQRKMTIFGRTLYIEEYHTCLSQKAYEEFLKNLPPQLQEALNEQHVQPVMDCTKEIHLNKFKGYSGVVLKRSSMKKECSQICPTAMVKIDAKADVITIHAETDEDLKSTQAIVRKYMTSLNYSNLTDLSPDVLKYLSTSSAEIEINNIFESKNIAACLGSSSLYYYGDDVEKPRDVIQNSVGSKFKKLSPQQVSLLKSEKSKTFREELQKQEVCLLNFKSKEGGVTVTCSKKMIKTHFDKIEQYLQENHVEEEHVLISEEKFQFIKSYSAQILHKLKADSQTCGALVEVKEDGIVLKGPKDFTDEAKESLERLKASINFQDFILTYNGIEEFLNSASGQSKLNWIQEQTKCLVYLKGYKVEQGTSMRNQPKLVGSCDIEGTKVNFYFGDFWFLSVDVIVNIVDENFSSDATKQILKHGGEDLREDFNKYFSKSNHPDNIIETRSGNLPCTKVFHIVSKLDMEEDIKNKFVKTSLEKCLKTASKKGYKRIALPFLGHDELQFSVRRSALNIRTALQSYLRNNQNLQEVILCDARKDEVKSFMTNFQNVSIDENFSASTKQRATSGKQTRNFGPASVMVKQGNLMIEKCDAIACGIKEDGNFNHSGGVAKAILSKCQEGIQNECSQKVSDLKDKGVIITSAPNLPCSNVILVNMTKYSRRWDQGVTKVLEMAENNDIKSLALPAFGAGSKSADHERIKDSLMKGITEFTSKNPKKLHDIRIILASQSLVNMFLEEETDEAEEDDSSAFVTSLSSDATVVLCADNVEKRQNAMKMLKKELTSIYSVKRMENKSLKLLRRSQKKELVKRGSQLQIKVKVQDDSYDMSGFKSDCFADIVKHVSIMVEEAKDKQTKAVLSNIPIVKIWQYKLNDRWKKFDPDINVNIESAYMQKKKEFTVSSRGHSFIIDFEEMKEYSTDDGINKGQELCPVRREDKRAGGFLPRKWEKMDASENLKIVNVQPGSPEFQAVEKNFRDGGASNAIKKIERIQNKALYQQYAARKTALERQNPKGHENEKRLFHGTDSGTIGLITENGFNRSYCGKNATAYGDGVYFAVNSSYSVNYAKSDHSGNCKMFQARVLVGVSAPSQSGMKFLPTRPGTNIAYDSGTAANIFVIFHDAQVYPEYIITF